MTQLRLDEISFPVYKLQEREPTVDGGLMYYEWKMSGQEDYKQYIIDDRSYPGKTLASRRLQMSGVQLYKINKAIFFLGDFIKSAKSTSWFIDAKGTLFRYTKTKMVPLICRKITKIIPSETTGKILEVEGINARFKTLFSPPKSHAYCLLLKIGNSYIYYGTSQDKCRDTVRKI